MSEARRNVPREVASTSSDNLATRLADLAQTYVGRCEGFCFPLTTPRRAVGQPMTAEDVNLLNWAQMSGGKAAASAGLSDDEQKGLDDVGKLKYIIETVHSWKPGTKALAAFRETALHLAVAQVVYDLERASGRAVPATFAQYRKEATDKATAAREKAITTILTAPDRADKYEAQVRAKYAEIMSQRFNPVRRRKSGAAVEWESDLVDIEI